MALHRSTSDFKVSGNEARTLCPLHSDTNPSLRVSTSDWTAELTAYPRDIAEAALAHAVADKTEAAYRRGDALDKRRRLMGEWARYCLEPSRGGVVALHG